jgi:hypothetical protein
MIGELVAIAQKLGVSISARRCLAETSAYLLSVVSWAPIEHSASLIWPASKKSEYEDELEYEYDIRNDCEGKSLVRWNGDFVGIESID